MHSPGRGMNPVAMTNPKMWQKEKQNASLLQAQESKINNKKDKI